MIDSASGELLPLLQTSSSSERLFARISEAIRVSLIVVLMSPVLVLVVAIAMFAALLLGVPLRASNSLAPLRNHRRKLGPSEVATTEVRRG